MTSLKSAYLPFIENCEETGIVLPLMVSAIYSNEMESDKFFSLKALKHWDVDEEKLSILFSNVINDKSLVSVLPEEVIENKYYLHYNDMTQRFTRIKAITLPKVGKRNRPELTVYSCDSSKIDDIKCNELYEIPSELNSIIDYPLHLYCRLPSPKCLEYLDLSNSLDFSHISIVKAMILGNSNIPTAIIIESGPGEVKFNIRNLFRKVNSKINKSWKSFCDAMNTGEIRQVLTKISECGTYTIAPEDDVYIIDINDFDAVHIRSTSMAIAECLYSSYLKEYFEIENFRERQEVPPNEICLGCVYIAYVGFLKRYTRIQIIDIDARKNFISFKTVDYPGNEMKLVEITNFKIYYLVQGLDIPPLYQTIKISSTEDKQPNFKNVLVNVVSRGGRYTLGKDVKNNIFTLYNNIPDEEGDLMEKVGKELEENHLMLYYSSQNDLLTRSCRLQAPIQTRRCSFNQSMSSVKGRLKLRCVASSKNII